MISTWIGHGLDNDGHTGDRSRDHGFSWIGIWMVAPVQDPLQRPNFVAVLDHLSDLQEAGEMTKMDAYYNSHGCVFI